jgi:uncharacterized protein YkwD
MGGGRRAGVHAAVAVLAIGAGAAVVLSGAGCGSRPSGRVGRAPSWRASAAAGSSGPAVTEQRPSVLRPARPGVPAYNDPAVAPAPSTPLARAFVAAVAREVAALGVPAPVADGRLFAVAAELAKVVEEDAPLPYAVVDFVMRHHGIIEPSPHLLVLWGAPRETDAIVAQLADRVPHILATSRIARIGIGQAEQAVGPVVVVALQPSFLETDAIPRQVAMGQAVRFRARVLAPYVDPHVYVTREDGRVDSAPMRHGQGGEIVAEVSCGARRGPQQIEITASDASGSAVLANFPVWCAAAPPDSVSVWPSRDAAPVTSPAAAERELVALLNQDRAAAGLAPLVIDGELAAVARAHSADMQRTGRVAHVSATSGTAADRVRAAGIRTPVVLENVARAYGVVEAEQGLMNSPGHRANILSAEATHLGVGLVLGPGDGGPREIFVTQVFIRVPPPVDLARARVRIERAIVDASRLEVDAELARIAEAVARDLARGVDGAKASARAAAELARLGHRFRRVTTVVTAVAEPEAFAAEMVREEGAVTHFGLGLAVGPHDVIGDAALYVVVLVGLRR